jgi:transposase
MNWHLGQNITKVEVLLFLRHLLAHLRGPVILIWDRLNAHRAHGVQVWCEARQRLAIEFLPPYAPELNPVEYLWSNLKYHRLSNHGLTDLDAIYHQARSETDNVKTQPSLLRSFFQAAGLRI